MLRWIGLLLLVFVAMAGWRIGGSLSSDAISMAVGVLFGILAGIPTALLVLASGRRRDSRGDERAENGYREQGRQLGYPACAPQPPVIVLTAAPGAMQPGGYGTHQPDARGYAQTGYAQAPGWPHERQHEQRPRHFKVVGEQETWIDE